jgi:hypothetical protein
MLALVRKNKKASMPKEVACIFASRTSLRQTSSSARSVLRSSSGALPPPLEIAE